MIEQSVGELINRLVWQKQLLRGKDADLRIGAFMGHLVVMGRLVVTKNIFGPP